MSSASSVVTYTSVYTDSEPGRVFWGADEDLSDGGSPRVIVYGYDGLPMLPVAPPSPDYIHGPEEPQTPPAPQDKDEHEPIFIQPHDPDFMPEPIYPEYIPLEDKHILLAEEQPLPPIHLVLADSAAVLPTDELVSPPEGTKLVMPPPSTNTDTTGARITVRLQAVISFPPEAEMHGLAALPSPPPLHMQPPVDRRDDIPRLRCHLARDPTETVPEIAPMTVGERVDLLMKDMIAHQETIQIMEDEAYAAREAWDHSIGLSQAMAKTLRVMGDMRREMGDIQAELLALRDQPRRARQPGGDARVPNHQDAPRDADRTKGVVGLTRWIEKMESVFQISGCAVENQVKFATCTLLDAALTWWNSQIRSLGPDAYLMSWEVLKKKMTNKYYPQGKIKKLEIELWNIKVKENNVLAYTERFQELTLICTKFVADETEKIDKEEKECIKGPGFKCRHGNNGGESRLTVISCSKAQEYLAKGCQIFLAQISAKKEEDRSEGKQLEDVPVVQDYPEFFPNDLPGLPPARPVEFQIDLIPGAALVARAPYRLAPSDMKELSEQLQ
nr:reverse transcriptase domain-containing protein [Tanacetum cinerariifolium]